jgi:hypothetical protein
MITDQQVAGLRALVTGDMETFSRLGWTSGDGYGERLPVLMATAFVRAAQQSFPATGRSPTWSGSSARSARGDSEYADLNASAPENMLLAALRDKPMRGEFGDFAKAYAQSLSSQS